MKGKVADSGSPVVMVTHLCDLTVAGWREIESRNLITWTGWQQWKW